MGGSSIRDNYRHGAVGEFLKESITSNADMSVVSAYFTIHAWDRLRTEFQKLNQFRFLFGEPTFIKSVNDEKTPAGEKTRSYKFEDDALHIPPESRLTQGSIARDCAAWLLEKAEIRSMVKPNFLHGKMYHITEPGGRQKAIVGSSNCTVHGLGLGLGVDKNIELNMIIDNDRDREALLEWFNQIWADTTGLVEDVKEKVLGYLAQFYAENPPEFIYYKTLYHIFSAWLDEQKTGAFFDEKTSLYESEIWNCLYDFQKDGVKGAINKIEKYSGCIIADSVGLGKTYEALAVIKYYELKKAKVLVICPKKLSKNWTVYQAINNQESNPFKKDSFCYAVLYHTDMGRTSGKSGANNIDLAHFDWSAFDLVVIDESHNFRGNAEIKEKDGEAVMNRAAWLMEKIIKSGYQTKVLMLSATPVNNTLRDLRNQIAFITKGKEDALRETCGIASYSEIVRQAQANFTRWAEQNSGLPGKSEDKRTKELLQRLDAAFFKLLDELTIARSRRHITGFYNMAAIGSFPRRGSPRNLYPDIDIKERFPPYDVINEQIESYKLSIFNPSFYLKPEKKAAYEQTAAVEGQKQFTQEGRERFLIGMMRVNFLKRLESSIASFKITLKRTINKIDEVLDKINAYNKTKNNDGNIFGELIPSQEELDSELWDEEDANAMQDALQIGKKIKFSLADLQLDEWAAQLRKDRFALDSLCNSAGEVSPERDAKLVELKKIITDKINNPYNQNNKKVIVFTAFYDTAEYLYNNLSPWITKEFALESALVYGSGSKTTFGKNDYDSILTNFSPRAKKRASGATGEKEIDILFATDCISEGQNLQDCDLLVNYDIHWNPVRIIQRFGRIDRIGSNNETIRLVNFWPTNDLEKYINLKGRVEARMALVDISATADDNILKTDQIEKLVQDDLNYRNQQLLKLRDEILDLEDMDETISLTDFTLDDFRLELSDYITNNRKQLENSPMGMYAIGKCPENNEIIQPGVIFCFAQKKNDEENNRINPLNPYYLVYIRDSGDVRYTYTHSKQILEIFRQICQGINAPLENLCKLFNDETQNGQEMSKYANLLKKAVFETILVAGKKNVQALLGGRDGLLIPQDKQAAVTDDFELVTWLVIKQEK